MRSKLLEGFFVVPRHKDGVYNKEQAKTRKSMLEAGFSIDSENEVYVMEGYGAYCQNIDGDIVSIDELLCKIGPSGTQMYSNVSRLIKEKGAEFVIGPAAPGGWMNNYDSQGLYCKNYKELIEKEKQQEAAER